MIYQLYKIDKNDIEANAAYYIDEQGRTISFHFNPDNTDYQSYLKWLEEGNTPLPAEEQA